MTQTPGCREPRSTPCRIDAPSLLAEHDRWLRAVVYARLRDAEAVDEVMQEVALAAVRQSTGPREAAKAAPWLYRIAVRQALLLRRKLGRQKRITQRYQQLAQRDGETDPLDWLLADERRQLVRRALAQIPPREVEVLLLKYAQNWRYRQIAEHLGLSESAVESRLHRARRRLRSELAAQNLVETS